MRDPEKNMEANISTKNKKIQLYNPEVVDWIREINPVDEEGQLISKKHQSGLCWNPYAPLCPLQGGGCLMNARN